MQELHARPNCTGALASREMVGLAGRRTVVDAAFGRRLSLARRKPTGDCTMFHAPAHKQTLSALQVEFERHHPKATKVHTYDAPYNHRYCDTICAFGPSRIGLDYLIACNDVAIGYDISAPEWLPGGSTRRNDRPGTPVAEERVAF